ncbi:hypothetical protein FACS189474_1050 [Bacteroidia bacterium]|nr:hypothetical protein FACS189474_1050 [Bacteroidia bacterium]
MSKRLLIFIILSLLVINVYTLVHFHRSKTKSVTSVYQNISESDELYSYKINFETNIQNSNIRLDKIVVKDSLGNFFPSLGVV